MLQDQCSFLLLEYKKITAVESLRKWHLWDVRKVGFLGKGPRGKRHTWEVSHGENSTGKTGLGKMSPGK